MLIVRLLRAMHPLPDTWLARLLRRVERALQQGTAAARAPRRSRSF